MSRGSCKRRPGCGDMPRLAPGPFTLPGRRERLPRAGHNTLPATARITARQNRLGPGLGGHGSGRKAGPGWAGCRRAAGPSSGTAVPGGRRPAPCPPASPLPPAVLQPSPQPRSSASRSASAICCPRAARCASSSTSATHLQHICPGPLAPVTPRHATPRPPQGWAGPGSPCPAQRGGSCASAAATLRRGAARAPLLAPSRQAAAGCSLCSELSKFLSLLRERPELAQDLPQGWDPDVTPGFCSNRRLRGSQFCWEGKARSAPKAEPHAEKVKFRGSIDSASAAQTAL